MKCPRVFHPLLCLAGLRSVLLCLPNGVTRNPANGAPFHPLGNWIPLAPISFCMDQARRRQVAVHLHRFSLRLNVIDNPSAPIRR